ncbi:hypothetical protein [Alicyclobacillus sp. SO9]|uniref:hypothetical protein n=1 Tax=Alicyclobacillus sp. SO9 TaxID=2665646 RepID=UPI0018E89507|nr:hypothetical protein [Alicyclobacillus sp. SO9]QQE80930.1 hypothetical protein GI364_11395 [Alicyclobacillus sp. SO9]
MSLDTVIKGANTVLKLQKGIARVHENAPESLSLLPATTLVPDKGDIDWPRKPNQRNTTHNLTLTLLVARGGDLAASDQALKPWVDTIIDLFDQHFTLEGTVFVAGIVSYDYGHVEYGGTTYLGVTYTLRAVELQAVNFHK